MDTLHAAFDVVLSAEMAASLHAHGKPFAGIDPAPERFHQMWERRSRTFQVTHATGGIGTNW